MSQFQSDLQEMYAQIESEFACSHETQELRRRINRNQAISYVKQCIRCGFTSSPIKKESALAFSDDDIPDYDYELKDKWSNQRSKKIQTAFETAKKKRADEYQSYLETIDWKGLRQKVFKRSGGMCEGCLENKATQVHHLTYEHVGNEFMWEVVAICNECHERYHKDDHP